MGEKKNEYVYDEELGAVRVADVDVYDEEYYEYDDTERERQWFKDVMATAKAQREAQEEALFAAQKQHAAEQTRKQFKMIRVVPR